MPHKRAKRSVREQQRLERGSDLAPGHHSLENETIPKSVARVLNSLSVRQQWKTNKRKAEDGEGKGKSKRRKTEDDSAAPKILPGESLQHFNKRVEQDMRPLVRSAVQSSLATTRKAKAEEELAKAKKKKKTNDAAPPEPAPPPPPPKHADRPKDFAQFSTSAPKRLNDIAQAPPEFKARKEKANTKAVTPEFTKHSGVLSMAQKAMMEAEREKAIARYRQLKADRRADADVNPS